MNELQLIKSESFGEVQADIYSNGNDMFMTINQLSKCLGYSDRSGVQKILNRNEYLRKPEFVGRDNLSHPQGGSQETTIFTEDGIYEITMLSGQPKAKQFRAWIRKVLKALRTGEAKIIPTVEIERLKIQAQQDRAKAMLLNAQNRTLKTLMGTIGDKKLSSIAVEVFGIKAIQEATGLDMGQYLPEVAKTYSATEVGERLGISANKVGTLANRYNLKTDEYGITVMDKSPYSSKEVANFRYYEKAIPVLETILAQQSA